VTGEELMRRIVISWLSTEFDAGGRHSRRVQKILAIEQGKDPTTLGNGGEHPEA
jgi:ribose 5-phosphate isomerase RpiB